MNIRIGAKAIGSRDSEDFEELDDMPLKLLEDPVCLQRAKECAFTAIMDGYQHIVYNFVRSG